jgi:hypothetical protein
MPDLQIFYPPDPYPVDGECVNCWKKAPLIWLADWGFWACEICAEECNLYEKAEHTCPVLFDQVIAAKSIREIQQIFNSHKCEDHSMKEAA